MPHDTLTGLDQPLTPGVLFSPRVDTVVFGPGLLEAIPEFVVLLLSNRRDRNRDGISARANYVWAKRAADSFKPLSGTDRAAIVAFLESL